VLGEVVVPSSLARAGNHSEQVNAAPPTSPPSLSRSFSACPNELIIAPLSLHRIGEREAAH
jgi:hypothetical protein